MDANFTFGELLVLHIDEILTTENWHIHILIAFLFDVGIDQFWSNFLIIFLSSCIQMLLCFTGQNIIFVD